MTLSLTSLQNGQVKEAVKLQSRRKRDDEGLFLIEGYRELSRAVQSGVKIQKLFICPSLFLGENEPELIEKIQDLGGEILDCTPSVFEKISYRDRPDGLIAVAFKMSFSLEDLTLSENPLIVIAESIEKPGNLGSILRSADGVGADAVIVCDRCTDIYNPNVVRASVGTLFTRPVIEASGEETLKWLRQNDFRVVATSPVASATFTEADFSGPVAIAVGTEQLGLSTLWLNSSDIQVSIPMKGTADSLNVATATTLLLYEVLRQRQ